MSKEKKILESRRHIEAKKETHREKVKRKKEELAKSGDRKEFAREEEKGTIQEIPQKSAEKIIISSSIEVDSTASVTEVEKACLKIPQLNLAKFTLNTISDLNTTILIESKAEKKLLIPQYRLERFESITAVSNFDMEFSMTVEKQANLRIPMYVLAKFSQIKPYKKFLIDKPIQQFIVDYSKTEKISDQITEISVQIQESRPKITSEEKIKEEVAEPASESEEYELLEGINFIEFLLGKGSNKILGGKPLCIIVERHPDKYEYVVATMCREVYREREGGYPQPIPVRVVEDVEFEFKAEISDQIIIVEEAKYSEILKKVISKFPFSSLGFLILVTDKPEELEMEIRKNIPEAGEYILKIEPVKIDEELKIKMVELISGSKLVMSYSFGEDFMNATQRFNDKLKEYLDFSKAPKELRVMWHKLMAKSPDTSEQASDEHSAMKSFVWQYLWEKHKRIPRLEDEKGVDVSISNEYYEIETFYGCGNPIAKLSEKMEKFTQNDNVFFVLRNMSILMHLKELISFKKTWKDLRYNVEILGINFDKKSLIPIEEIKKTIRAREQSV